ncbi:hypothetical protein THRCLA_01771 [Thraustotheca clavata]|uniref:JmjC domain-containing protein n=1 Tax=Thraustotheca clavata TaxID=74557 RepID=A0A1W0A7A8_9STRA|nr:hypothetical protein THRCLA_01771 [Thraustotheca clavata]
MSKRSSQTKEVIGNEKKVKTKCSKIHYNGWEVPEHDYTLDVIEIKDVTPEIFFNNYIACRRPVVLRGFLQDPEFVAPSKWSNDYLKATAGDAKLMVEERSSIDDSYGQGNEVPMTFREFLELLEKKDMLHYLTTQDVEADPDTGRPGLMAPFIEMLSHDFPLRPSLLGHLVPQNINIWMGNAIDGSTTGLHHDYHDNLYILLRGQKKFRLYSPSDVEAMYTRGQLLHVHANGRINYQGEETTAYGADLKSDQAAQAAKAQEAAERELELAERDAANGIPGAQARIAAAEAKLEAAMDAAMSFEFDEDNDEEDDQDIDGEILEDELNSRRIVDKTIKDPINFSCVKTSHSMIDLEAEFPLFSNAKAAYCTLQVGDMLYLPASWFHEVTSYSSKANDGHLALNYWYHPPDAFTSFTSPYSSSFWPDDFNARYTS